MTIAAAINQFRFPNIVESTEDIPHEEWLKLRKNYIGGSEAAAIIGLSRYETPIGVYYSKVGEIEKTFSDRSLQKMKMGNLLEPVIGELFAEATGKHVVRQHYYYQHPVHKFMGGNIDFGIYGENAGLECKNSGVAKDWENGEVPDEYYMQCMHYMAVTGADRWYLAVLIEGWDFRYTTIERDNIIIKALIDKEKEFWETFIIPQQPPMFDGSESAKALLKVMYPTGDESIDPVEFGDDIDEMWIKKKNIADMISNLKKDEDAIKNHISSLIGDGVVGMSKQHIFSYKNMARKGYTVEPTTYRQLSVKARKA